MNRSQVRTANKRPVEGRLQLWPSENSMKLYCFWMRSPPKNRETRQWGLTRRSQQQALRRKLLAAHQPGCMSGRPGVRAVPPGNKGTKLGTEAPVSSLSFCEPQCGCILKMGLRAGGGGNTGWAAKRERQSGRPANEDLGRARAGQTLHSCLCMRFCSNQYNCGVKCRAVPTWTCRSLAEVGGSVLQPEGRLVACKQPLSQTNVRTVPGDRVQEIVACIGRHANSSVVTGIDRCDTTLL